MRKNKTTRIIIFILLLLGSNMVSAQPFKGGIMLGFTGSQRDGDNLGGYNKLGLSAGMFASVDFNEKWAMQLEFKYIMKGSAKLSSKTDASVNRYTLHYFEMPLLAKYILTKKLTAETGLAASYLAKAACDLGQGKRDCTADFEKMDYSYVAGMYYLLNKNFSLNLKLIYSFKASSHYPGNITTWGTYGQYNNVLDFSVYYTL